jgi:small subunit ribosomal protein S9
MEIINTIGRRKTAVARIYLKPVKTGSASITVNKRDAKEYFPTGTLQYVINQPLLLTGSEGKYDIKVNLDGGGSNGQAEALRLAISRALCKIDPEFRLILKPKGLLRRDPRMVERKKPGQPKARKKFQFSKR